MTKKYKWYKDKWGWVGLPLGIVYDFFIEVIEYTKIGLNGGIKEYYAIRFPDGFILAIVFPIVGFIIGILIHKLFITFKWVKH